LRSNLHHFSWNNKTKLLDSYMAIEFDIVVDGIFLFRRTLIYYFFILWKKISKKKRMKNKIKNILKEKN